MLVYSIIVGVFLVSCSQPSGPPAEVVTLLTSPDLRVKDQENNRQYRVKSGDTLCQIAKHHRCSVQQLVKNNHLKAPYHLYLGQILKLPREAVTTHIQHPQITRPTCSATQKTNPHSSTTKTTRPRIPSPTLKKPSETSMPQWQWPTRGKVVDAFSSDDGGNRGINIVGTKGQAIYSSAAGRVVYAGNALPGYGHLLIIKHNDDWLTAYAHNDKLLVRELQPIQAGEKIAIMGSSGTHSVRLHFQIRYQGKSVNPLHYLPQR